MPKQDNKLSRRKFIKSSILASAGVGASIQTGLTYAQAPAPDDFLTIDPWTKIQRQGQPNLTYGLPTKFEKNVARDPYGNGSKTPLQKLHGIITPNGLHFERHHGGIPEINPDLHRLVIHGLVDRPLIFTMDDIVRFPSVSQINFLECSGNTWAELKKRTWATVQETHGLLSCCEWTGVRLSTLLQEAGVKPEAKWVLAEGADSAAMTRSIPIQKALDDAIVAYGQNGEMLRAEQGYPLRLFLPGFEGNMSIKWLRRLKLGTEAWQTREETSAYTDLGADGKALQFTFLMGVKSVITTPSAVMKLKGKGFYEISGIAWTGSGKIRRVEVSVNGGKSWNEAILQAPILDKCLTKFSMAWNWNGEEAVLMSRAYDSNGEVQPSLESVIKARSSNAFYHNNAIQPWVVASNGEVSNGR
ncbi:MAG: sulfite dehydrogenase [Burkholderiaceae bacterium]